MRVFEGILVGIFGAVLFIGLISAIIGIASAVNEVSYRQQVADWFGPVTEQVIDDEDKDTVDDEQNVEDETANDENTDDEQTGTNEDDTAGTE